MSAASEEVSDSECPGKRKAPRRGVGWTKVRSGSNSQTILARCGEVLDGADGAAEEECFRGEGCATEGSADEVKVRRHPHCAKDWADSLWSSDYMPKIAAERAEAVSLVGDLVSQTAYRARLPRGARARGRFQGGALHGPKIGTARTAVPLQTYARASPT